MKRLASILLMLCAMLTPMAQGLFDHLDYHDGVATIQVQARLNGIGMYAPRGEIDTIVHEFPGSAVAFDQKGEHYYIAIDDSLDLSDISFRDSVRMTITVWRDRQAHNGTSPYAEVTAIERLRAVGEIDTIGRVIGYGDTLYITHLDGHWDWRPYLTGDSRLWGLSEDEHYLVLHMNEAFCRRLRGKLFRHVDYYDRGYRIWHEYLLLKDTGEPNLDLDNCTIWLHEKPYGYKE